MSITKTLGGLIPHLLISSAIGLPLLADENLKPDCGEFGSERNAILANALNDLDYVRKNSEYSTQTTAELCILHALSIGANPMFYDDETMYRYPLTQAAQRNHPRIVQALIDAGAHVNHANKVGQTALTWAAYADSVEAIETLLVNGAHPDFGFPLEVAAYWNNTDSMRVLIIGGARINLENERGGTPLTEAARNNSLDSIKLLFNVGLQISGDVALAVLDEAAQEIDYLKRRYEKEVSESNSISDEMKIRWLKKILDEKIKFRKDLGAYFFEIGVL